MRYLSVCSGIEAASVAWHPLGWECVGVAEIEKFPSAVLAHHYPNVPNFGDLTRYQEWPSELAPDLIVGGTPCQSFSVAGLRAGLADPRGNLALVFLGLVDRYRPRWVLWENVPGVRSSAGGRDFGAFLGALGELGYGWAYRSLDAQYFGLAQRRERVFVVGCLGDWRAPAAVLLEPQSLCGDSAPRREARESAARDAGTGAGVGCYRWQNNAAGIVEDAVAATLRRESATTDERSVPAYTLTPKVWPDVAMPVMARDAKGPRNFYDGGLQASVVAPIWPDVAMPTLPASGAGSPRTGNERTEAEFLVSHSLRAEGFDASEDGTGRGTPLVAVAFAENQRGELRTSDIAAQLTVGGGKPGQGYPAVMYGIDCEHNVSDVGAAIGPLMKDSPSGGGHPLPAIAFAIQERAICENPNAGPDGIGVKSDGTAYTLEARTVPQAVAFVHKAGGTQTTLGYDPASETTPTLPKSETLAVAFAIGSHAGAANGDQTNRSHATGGPVGLGVSENLSYSLRGGRTQTVATSMAVRRLTPRECERLQGFPDDYTLIPYRNGMSADGPRYKALGNSMAVPVMSFIGRRIAEVDAMAVDLERRVAA